MKSTYTSISLGAGRQSTALYLGCSLGLPGFPRADWAIFGDTMHELPDTYRHLDNLEAWARENGGIPIYRRSLGDLWKGAIEGGVHRKDTEKKKITTTLPYFMKKPDGSQGFMRRQCTAEYKIRVIKRTIREILDIGPRSNVRNIEVTCLIGISLDEAHRMKDSDAKWLLNAYPLVDARLTVNDCAGICRKHIGYVPTKSACIFCPFHGNDFWKWMKEERPEQFEKACRLDEEIRRPEVRELARMTSIPYIHRSMIPLRDVRFGDEHQMQLFDEQFGNDCSGHCGV